MSSTHRVVYRGRNINEYTYTNILLEICTRR